MSYTILVSLNVLGLFVTNERVIIKHLSHILELSNLSRSGDGDNTLIDRWIEIIYLQKSFSTKY